MSATVTWQLPAIATAAVLGIVLNLVFLLFPAKTIDREFAEAPVENLEV